MEEEFVEEQLEPVEHAGIKLKAARDAAGFDLAQVAAQTRIPQRHLQALEAGDYASLPARTYATGFARTYARFLGLDEVAIVDQVRDDLSDASQRGAASLGMEPGDPARVPSRSLAWFAVLAATVLGVGIFAFYRTYFTPGLGPAPLTQPTPIATAKPRPSAATTAPVASGPVVFTSTMDGSWISFYDATGAKLFEGMLDKGESFTVPDTADGPQVRTGRPYAFAITVGGRPVAKLGEEDTVVKDIPVSAAALAARPAQTPASEVTKGGTPPAAAPKSGMTPIPGTATRPSAAANP